MFDPLAVKGMTFSGQLYGVPYSIENIALIRNTDLAPDCPATMEDLVAAGKQLVKDKKATEHHGPPGRPEGRRLSHLPAVHVGWRLVLRHDRDRRPGPDQRDRRLRRNRSRPARSSTTSARRATAPSSARSTTRTPSRCSPAARRRSSSPARGPSPTSRRPSVNYDICAIPAVRGRQAGRRRSSASTASTSPARARTRPSPRSSSPASSRPRTFQTGLYAVDPRRPALTEAVDRGHGRGSEHPQVRGGRRQDGTILPGHPGDGPGLEPVRRRRGGDRRRRLTRRPPSRRPPRRSATGSPTSSRRPADAGDRDGGPAVRRPPTTRSTVRRIGAVGVTEEERAGDRRYRHQRQASWGLAAGSTRGLLGKIILLAVVAGDRRRGGDPARSRPGVVPGCGPGPGRRVAIFVVYLQPWHIPHQVPRAGHDLPDRLPGHPGRVHVRRPRSRTSVTATAGRRRTRSPRSRRSSVQQVPGSAEYVLTIATEGDAATGDLVFLLYDPTTKTVQQGTDRGPDPVRRTRTVSDRRAR